MIRHGPEGVNVARDEPNAVKIARKGVKKDVKTVRKEEKIAKKGEKIEERLVKSVGSPAARDGKIAGKLVKKGVRIAENVANKGEKDVVIDKVDYT